MAYDLTSNYLSFHNEIKSLLKYYTVNNSYPKPIFYKVLKSSLFNKYIPRSPDICVPKQIKYI